MVLKNYDELILKVQNNHVKKKVAVVAAHDEHTLEAVFKAVKDKIVEPILIGDKEKIKKILDDLHISFDDNGIINSDSDVEASNTAINLINDNSADFIMKGKIQSSDILKAVVNKNNGLGTGKIMSHVAIFQVPSYHKLIAVTDGGMMIYPNVEEKAEIINNAVDLFLTLGYECPKVAVLTAVEKVNPKMQETVDADILKKMNINKEIKNCIVEGPISYDLTMSRDSAQIKGFESPVTEDADILMAPNMTAGNILSKTLIYSAGSKMSGIIVGAKVPVVLTSRGATSEEKYLSLALSALAAGNK